MRFDGRWADSLSTSHHLGIVQPFNHQTQHLALAFGQVETGAHNTYYRHPSNETMYRKCLPNPMGEKV